MGKVNADRRVTAVLLGSFALILLVWDIYVAYNPSPGDTISELIRDLSHDWYALPFILGIVMGHFFWNQPEDQRKPPEERLKIFFTRVVPLGALALLRDFVNLKVPLPTFPYANLVAFTGGFLVGARWWPQAIPPEKGHENEQLHP